METSLHQLYQKFISNTCNEDELDALFHYFKTTDSAVLRELVAAELEKEVEEPLPSDNEVEKLEAIHKQIKQQLSSRTTKPSKIFYRIAAAAILIISLSVAGLYVMQSKKPQTDTIAAVKTTPIGPGHKQATLTLANGKKILVTNSVSGLIALQGNTSIAINKGIGIKYSPRLSKNLLKTSYNTLETARGEQSPYPLILSDGTKVWLNAASSITFPTAFTGNERIVKVAGEAYFEVTHDKLHPFKVISDKQEIAVLGTHFNIKSYPDDQTISTTLLEGSVKVRDLSSGQSGVLKPGQQSNLDRTNRKIAISTVNIEEIVAWKNGFFVFDNQNISNIMQAMSRWYDVDVKFKHPNNNERFGGTFSRSTNLPDILNSLEKIGKVHFEIDKRKIIVSD
ncbi:DUF4974 domain-containing protein [Mucilaginibacter corticis]|uniref:DUF4974 domain-containing protein n=1 Tax=Mucilaginibacter corticis TaxID=2597670 RepID=A0A556MRS7_9SPHI|nr:FecR domain-containing protein [Mucilaginibacter corticis]TSJ42640.1 DUF4974 domain-containing protein [Mucilaginibacter corticis]